MAGEQFVGPDITGDGKPDVDITNAGDFTVIGGVTFTDAVRVGSGTGNYNTFLAISNNSGVESGFNSDDTPPIDATNSDIDQAKTHTVLLSSLVQITVGGVQYYQVRLDLNEANSDPNAQISLDQFKIYTSTNGGLESTTQLFNPANATLKYDMDAGQDISILLSDAGSTGSGTDDYAILIPVSTFAGLDPTTTYFYLYTQLGAADGADWNAGATFEEFNLENGVALTGTKFNDLDGDGIKDAGEGPVAGVTIFIDANKNGVFDAGERSTVTDANGNYTFFGVGLNQTVWIDEVVPAGAVQTTGDHETVVISSNATGTIVVDPIGNHYPIPHITLTKDAQTTGECADVVGENVTYTVVAHNDGELALTNVVVKDAFEGGAPVTLTVTGDANSNGILDAGEVWLSGDTGNDGIMGVGETWTYTYVHTVTQGDIDSNGGDNDGTLDNVASVNANSTNGSVSASDDASADVCQNPAISIDKTAETTGECADTVGEAVTYTVVVDNTGNVSLDNVVVTDSFEGGSPVTLTVTGDSNSNGVLDAGEVWLSGDTGDDGIMGVDETWTYTYIHTVTQGDIDSNGGDNDGTLDNVATADATAVNSGEAAATVSDDASADVCQYPTLEITKDADVPGGCADTVGELVTYTVTLENTGNVSLDNVVLTDSFEGGSDVTMTVTGDSNSNGVLDVGEVWLSGDTGDDGIMDVGEIWTYNYVHEVTQADIDSNGGDGDGTLDNIAKANATAVTSGAAADTVSDDAAVDVCQNPGVDLTKYVDVGFGWDDANTGPGPNNVNIGGDVNFKITVENTGNVTLTDVDITDTYLSGGAPGTGNLLVDNGALTAYALAHNAVLAGDNGNGLLDVGETWTITYTEAFDPLSFQPGAHLNTADVTDGQGVSDEDSAYYFSLVDTGPCPRTPGFWQNNNNGGLFWDGVQGNEKHAGEPDFPTGELLYAVDSNNDGVINGSDQKGLLIGDYNKDGLTDNGEDTLFVAYADARSLINSSNKQLNSLSGDGKFILGRDMVASWLNYLMGSGFGDASDPQSPHHYLDDAIDWMQIYSGTTAGGLNESFDQFKLSGPIIKTSSATWNTPVSGIDHSAQQMHNALDYYNNTGQTQVGGVHYANCENALDVQLLNILYTAHPELF